jgi:hypothetical protein
MIARLASRFRAHACTGTGLFASWALRSFIVLLLRDGGSSDLFSAVRP